MDQFDTLGLEWEFRPLGIFEPMKMISGLKHKPSILTEKQLWYWSQCIATLSSVMVHQLINAGSKNPNILQNVLSGLSFYISLLNSQKIPF